MSTVIECIFTNIFKKMVNCACYLSVNVSVLLKGLVNSVPHYLVLVY